MYVPYSGLLFFEYSIGDFDGGGNLIDRSLALVRGLVHKKDEGYDSDKAIVEVIEKVLLTPIYRAPETKQTEVQLLAALRIDGFDVSNGNLIPTTPAPVQLAPEISWLESKLESSMFDVSLKHYRQALDSFVAGNYEASNGQIRSFIEDLFIEITKTATKKIHHDASAALQHLRNKGCIDDAQWNYLRYFWSEIQDNGPHHGLTDEEEALFRVHVATATGRYLLTMA